jgi:iron complex outermembrane receptor protein
VTVLNEMSTQASPKDDWTDWKGTDGPTELSGVQNMAYDYKTFTTVSYGQGNWNASLRWRHLPSLDSISIITNPATTDVPTDAYDMFDFSGRYTFGGRYDLRFGIDNLFDVDPEIMFQNATTSGYGSTNENYYDILGRRFYLGMHVQF